VTWFQIAGRTVGPGHPCYVIAEAGVNHNGDPELAVRLIDIAADAGADAVKFQTFDPDQLASAAAPKAEYQRRTTGATTSQHDMLKALALPATVFRDLAHHAAQRGIHFLSTPFDVSSAELLRSIGVPAFKTGSGDLTNHPLLAALSGWRLPLIVSTGMSTLDEVKAAAKIIHSYGNPPLALLHCVSSYPAPLDQCNLLAMHTLRAAFDVPVGWSDHTRGSLAAIAAVAMGANLIEKHFTVDRSLPGPDHEASLEPGELAGLIRDLRAVESTFGTGVKTPVACEAEVAGVARRSLYFTRDLRPGHVLAESDLVALRPAGGMSPVEQPGLLGRVLRVNARRGDPVRADDLEARGMSAR
jgi:N,N'-diacetyllegionaminate synthase